MYYFGKKPKKSKPSQLSLPAPEVAGASSAAGAFGRYLRYGRQSLFGNRSLFGRRYFGGSGTRLPMFGKGLKKIKPKIIENEKTPIPLKTITQLLNLNFS